MCRLLFNVSVLHCGRLMAGQQIFHRFAHRFDGRTERQRVFAAEKQTLVHFAAEGFRQLNVDAELADFAQTVAQAAGGQAVDALRTAFRVGFGIGLQFVQPFGVAA